MAAGRGHRKHAADPQNRRAAAETSCILHDEQPLSPIYQILKQSRDPCLRNPLHQLTDSSEKDDEIELGRPELKWPHHSSSSSADDLGNPRKQPATDPSCSEDPPGPVTPDLQRTLCGPSFTGGKDPPTWIPPTRVPRAVVVPGGATLLPLLTPRHHPLLRNLGQGLRIPLRGHFIADVHCVALIWTGWFRAPASSRPAVPVQPRQSILHGDVLWVYLSAPAELQCSVGDCSMKYSGAVWTCRVKSELRHVEFEHGVRVNDRIRVCLVCDSPLRSRPSYHHSLATATLAPSTEAPQRRCSVCDATFTSARDLANHLRCHDDQAGPSGTACARRVRHVSSSTTTFLSSSVSPPPAVSRASRRQRPSAF
ncbi:hypothetical protein MRX96_048032 [Rhipicephalus microplus]